MTAGVKAGTTSFVLLNRNMVNSLLSSCGEESGPQGPPMGQRAKETGASEGCPVIRADRNQDSTRKRADFQLVVADEKVVGIFA
jgi:hypothetical protein